MRQVPRMDHQQLLDLRRACKEAAIAILPGASEGQLAIVTEKIYLAAAGEALGSIAAAKVLGGHAEIAPIDPNTSVSTTLESLNREHMARSSQTQFARDLAKR